MITVPNAFTPTHKHHRAGVEYEVVKNCKLKIGTEWVSAILYRDREGELFVRPESNFLARFNKIPDDPARTTFERSLRAQPDGKLEGEE